MGFWKNEQLALLEQGYSVEEANAAIARRSNPERAQREQRAKLRGILQDACDNDKRVAIGLNHKPARGRLKVYGMSARFVETSRGAINLDLITAARIVDEEKEKPCPY